MQPARLLKLILLILSISVVGKPCFATKYNPLSTAQSGNQGFSFFSKTPREKYDDRHSLPSVQEKSVKAYPIGVQQFHNVALLQSALEAKLTARHLLHIHFRIIPERKSYIRFRKITV